LRSPVQWPFFRTAYQQGSCCQQTLGLPISAVTSAAEAFARQFRAHR
jgi:hypothetical protein